ncbi:hypothetical protein STAFG_4372 [Streptomyces afghaniensis 772]|uniref:Uncharacterized protein n=1 Tax=Streptomyces afghaniensis 772 TaxID=1283301 RepID=S4MSM9_9ACTN|nr:hypothetical protein STAFG_4372 [Streptomyces afghaniensis 772]
MIQSNACRPCSSASAARSGELAEPEANQAIVVR